MANIMFKRTALILNKNLLQQCNVSNVSLLNKNIKKYKVLKKRTYPKLWISSITHYQNSQLTDIYAILAQSHQRQEEDISI